MSCMICWKIGGHSVELRYTTGFVTCSSAWLGWWADFIWSSHWHTRGCCFRVSCKSWFNTLAAQLLAACQIGISQLPSVPREKYPRGLQTGLLHPVLLSNISPVYLTWRQTCLPFIKPRYWLTWWSPACQVQTKVLIQSLLSNLWDVFSRIKEAILLLVLLTPGTMLMTLRNTVWDAQF
jgi:hypothetical protein